MKVIRKGVFETNSSSCHSISISTVTGDELYEKTFEKLEPNSGSVLILSGGEFGWGIEEYTDALTKANYIVATYNEVPDMLKEVIMEQNPEIKDVKLGVSGWSYVDHESSGVAWDAMRDKETLKYYLFDKNSTLYIDNDNH